MARFVIHLYRLEEDIEKLSRQLKEHEKSLLEKGLRPTNYNFKSLIKEINNFKTTLDNRITETAKQISDKRRQEGKEPNGPIDIYGNTFLNSLAYKYVELSYNNLNFFDTVRLLGGINFAPVRFFISNMENDFSVTTLRLVSEIRDIVKEKQELKFDEISICDDDNSLFNEIDFISGKKKKDYKYNWETLSKKFFEPSVEYEKINFTKEQIEEIVDRHNEKTFVTMRELEQQLEEIEQKKEEIVEFKKKQIIKQPNPAEELFNELKKRKEELQALKAQDIYQNIENMSNETIKNIEKTSKEIEESIKTFTEDNLRIVTNWIDQHSIACLLEEAIKCVKPKNITCKQILSSLTPSEIFDRLNLLFPKGSDTLMAIEKAIEQKIYEGTGIPEQREVISGLKKRVVDDEQLLKELQDTRNSQQNVDQEIIDAINNLQEKIEEYKNTISQYETELEQKITSMEADLELSKKQSREIRNGGGNLAAIFSLPEEGQEIGSNTLTGKILAAIDTIFPLEDMCEAFNQTLSINFTGLDFRLPEPQPVDDIFGNLSVTIDSALSTLIVEALLSFIDTFLQDLINCDNLDNFISQIVNSSLDEDGVENINKLFSGINLQEIVDDSYDSFINTISNKTENIFSISSASGSFGKIETSLSNKDIQNIFTTSTDFSKGINTTTILEETGQTLIDLAEASGKTQQQINEQIFGSGEYFQTLFQQGKFPDGNWVVDSTGTKFEIVDGIKIVDLKEIDKYMKSLSDNAALAISKNANISRQALADAFGEISKKEEEPKQQQQKQVSLSLSKQEKQEIKDEFVCVITHAISLLSPSQVIKLFAGNATDETINVAAKIIEKCAPNLNLIFSNDKKVEQMFSTFGNVAGLDNLEENVSILADSVGFDELSEPEFCGAYDSLEDFRKDLMLNVADEQQIEQILNEARKEKVQKLREMGNAILDTTNGNLPGQINRDSNKIITDSLKAILENQEIVQSPAPVERQNGKNLEQEIEKIANENFENSPVVKKIFKMVLDSLFSPINDSFEKDMEGFIDAFSDVTEAEEIVEREIELKVGDRKIKTINPVFKDLIDSGLIPALKYKFDNKDEPYATMVDKSNFGSLEIKNPLDTEKSILRIIKDIDATAYEPGLYVSGEESQNFLVEGLNNAPIKPVLKKVNKKDVGASFKKNIGNLNVSALIDDEMFDINLTGYAENLQDSYMNQIMENIDVPSEISDAMKNLSPSWNVGLKEYKNGGELYSTISLETRGVSVRPGGRIDPFYIEKPFRVEKKVNITTETLNLLNERYQTQEKHRKEVFDDIIFENFKKLIFQRNNENINIAFSNSSYEIYGQFIQSFLNSSTESLKNSDLLQYQETYGGRILKKIETLDFAKKCKNVLDFKTMKKQYKEMYDLIEEPEVTENQRLGLEPRPSRTKEASLLVIARMIVKILCFETIIKSLPAFNFYKYSKNLVENDLMITLVSNFILFEIERIEIKDVVLDYVKKYYDKQVELEKDGYQKITQEERDRYLSKDSKIPIELKKMVEKEFSSLLKDVKEIVGEQEFVVSSADDFIIPIFENFKVVNVHKTIKQDSENQESIFFDDGIENEFVIQRYIRLPYINKNSKLLTKYPEYFTTSKIKELNRRKVVSFQEAKEIFSEIGYSISEDFEIYNCESTENALYNEPYRFGLRIVNVSKRKNIKGPTYTLDNEEYPYLLDICSVEKTGYVLERETNTGKIIEYDVMEISREEIKINQDESFSSFINRNNENRYISEFYIQLRDKMMSTSKISLLFGYSLPLKEIASMLIVHTNLINNISNMKYVLEPSKETIAKISNIIVNMGDRKNSKIDEMLQNIKSGMENMGNPAGPIDFDAFKMYARTPIQILKSLATIVDPNIALADKINGGISLAGSLVGQKINIPYSVLSLALLPFPIFGGLIPQIPPLTSYNMAPPLGPAFLLLEPLLWDLPWFQAIAKEREEIECEDKE